MEYLNSNLSTVSKMKNDDIFIIDGPLIKLRQKSMYENFFCYDNNLCNVIKKIHEDMNYLSQNYIRNTIQIQILENNFVHFLKRMNGFIQLLEYQNKTEHKIFIENRLDWMIKLMEIFLSTHTSMMKIKRIREDSIIL